MSTYVSMYHLIKTEIWYRLKNEKYVCRPTDKCSNTHTVHQRIVCSITVIYVRVEIIIMIFAKYCCVRPANSHNCCYYFGWRFDIWCTSRACLKIADSVSISFSKLIWLCDESASEFLLNSFAAKQRHYRVYKNCCE